MHAAFSIRSNFSTAQKLLTAFAVFFAFVFASAIFSGAHAQTIRAIDIEGNQRVDDATIQSYMVLEVGRAYSASGADQSLKALFETGLFEDVSISFRGATVFVVLVENPIINRVVFEGNKKLKDKFLAEQIQLQPSSTFSRAKAQADTRLIQALYARSGRFGTTVSPKIIDLDRNRVNLVFEIDEGGKTGVERISFIGNFAFSDGSLREVVSTGETNLLSVFRSNDIYDPQRLEADQEALRRFYLSKGYADFRVISAVADFDPDEGAFFITFTVDEGPKYRFGDITVETFIRELDPARLRGLVKAKPGKVYDADLVDDSLEAITIDVATQGYAFARVRPNADRDPVNQTIGLVFTVEEGPRVFVERIEIRGNTRTLDRVIRREFDLAEGDAYNQVLVDRAERRLKTLNYFESVRIRRVQGSAPDRAIIVVQVVEQPTGELSVGGGYSTSEGLIGDISISERNLLGRGQAVRLSLGLSAVRRSVTLSFTEPYFLDRRVSAGFDVFYRDTDLEDESNFNDENWGGGLRLGFLVAKDLTLGLRYGIEFKTVSLSDDVKPSVDIDGNGTLQNPNTTGLNEINLGANDIRAARAQGTIVVPTQVSPYILATEGESTTSLVGATLTLDKRDFPRAPRNGYYLQGSTDIAGVGGDRFFARAEGEGRAYRELTPTILAVGRVRGGVMTSLDGDDDVPIDESFFLGPDLVRGFERSGFGPRAQLRQAGADGVLNTADDVITNSDALGGTAYWGATAEVRFPVPVLPRSFGLDGAVFADVGTLYNVGELGDLPTGNASRQWSVLDDSSVRASVGFGLLWQSPIGPVRTDFAWPLAEEDFDETQVFRFSGGTRF